MVTYNNEEKLAFEKLSSVREKIYSQISRVIVGQNDIIDQMLMGLFSRGHIILIGVPGLAKTLMIKTLSSILDLKFSRIQFTPDLMPNDITGTDIIEEDIETRRRNFKFIKGPVFGNIILADEINRTPPKTQAALLQSMQEYQVTAGGKTYDLDLPFFVLATQNPIEQEGTYPLPEAQLDRFMFSLILNYPDEDEELEIVKRTTIDEEPAVDCVLSRNEIISLQSMVRKVPVSEQIYKYAVSIVRKTRPGEKDCHPEVKQWLQWGAGPRASQYIVVGAKARSVLSGREGVSEEDIRKIAYPVLQHRLITNFNAEASGITPRQVIDTILEKT